MRECVNCKYGKGSGSDVWCGHNPKGKESYMFETDCPYYKNIHDSDSMPFNDEEPTKNIGDNISERFTFRTIKGKHDINLNGAYNIFDNGEILGVIDVVDKLNEYEEVRVILLRLNHELRKRNHELYELNNKLQEDLEFSTRTEIAHHKVIEDELRKENEKLQREIDMLKNTINCNENYIGN